LSATHGARRVLLRAPLEPKQKVTLLCHYKGIIDSCAARVLECRPYVVGDAVAGFREQLGNLLTPSERQFGMGSDEEAFVVKFAPARPKTFPPIEIPLGSIDNFMSTGVTIVDTPRSLGELAFQPGEFYATLDGLRDEPRCRVLGVGRHETSASLKCAAEISKITHEIGRTFLILGLCGDYKIDERAVESPSVFIDLSRSMLEECRLAPQLVKKGVDPFVSEGSLIGMTGDGLLLMRRVKSFRQAATLREAIPEESSTYRSKESAFGSGYFPFSDQKIAKSGGASVVEFEPGYTLLGGNVSGSLEDGSLTVGDFQRGTGAPMRDLREGDGDAW